MGRARGVKAVAVGAALFGIVGWAAMGRADVTTERSASILVFPKLMFDSTGLLSDGTSVDTVIQISNTSNSMVFAHCFYLNATPVDASRPVGPSNPAQWQEVDFEIVLTKQQPTHWVLSSGRLDDPTDNRSCKDDCSTAGFDPGRIPPAGSDPFIGELRCIEVDSSGAPISGNHLKGEATLVWGDAQASKYNAIGILGLTDSNNGDSVLCLGGGGGDNCPTGAEYNACPNVLTLNHFAELASDPVVEALDHGDSSNVTTELTLVPCTQDFENQVAPPVVVQFLITNEFEAQFSTSTTVTCWGNFRLNTIGNVGRILEVGTLGSRFAQTRMVPATPEDGGVLGVAEEFHEVREDGSVATGRAALNLFGDGARPLGDVITLPGAF